MLHAIKTSKRFWTWWLVTCEWWCCDFQLIQFAGQKTLALQLKDPTSMNPNAHRMSVDSQRLMLRRFIVIALAKICIINNSQRYSPSVTQALLSWDAVNTTIWWFQHRGRRTLHVWSLSDRTLTRAAHVQHVLWSHSIFQCDIIKVLSEQEWSSDPAWAELSGDVLVLSEKTDPYTSHPETRGRPVTSQLCPRNPPEHPSNTLKPAWNILATA